VVYVSATPASYELEKVEGNIVEQVIRPTGLMDPEIEVKPAREQIDNLLYEIRKRVDKGERVVVDRPYVREHLGNLIGDEDLSRYIL